MKKQELINVLSQLNQTENVKITLTMKPNSVSEVNFITGTWKNNYYKCDHIVTWNQATLSTQEHTVEELIELLNGADINEMCDHDFNFLEIESASDGSADSLNVEWNEPLSSEEEDTLDELNMYNDGNIDESKCYFLEGSILSMTVEVDNKTYTI